MMAVVWRDGVNLACVLSGFGHIFSGSAHG